MEIMIDLETLDTKPSAVVLSIGVVGFSLDGEIAFRRLYTLNEESVQQQLNRGRTVSASTLRWWFDDSRLDARRALNTQYVIQVYSALSEVSRLVTEHDAAVWGNGAAFDLSILRSLYESFHQNVPWSHRDERCYRTLRAMYKGFAPDQYAAEEAQYVSHIADEDALAQAKMVAPMLAAIRSSQRYAAVVPE